MPPEAARTTTTPLPFLLLSPLFRGAERAALAENRRNPREDDDEYEEDDASRIIIIL
jgi:hypothetical protein